MIMLKKNNVDQHYEALVKNTTPYSSCDGNRYKSRDYLNLGVLLISGYGFHIAHT